MMNALAEALVTIATRQQRLWKVVGGLSAATVVLVGRVVGWW